MIGCVKQKTLKLFLKSNINKISNVGCILFSMNKKDLCILAACEIFIILYPCSGINYCSYFFNLCQQYCQALF